MSASHSAAKCQQTREIECTTRETLDIKVYRERPFDDLERPKPVFLRGAGPSFRRHRQSNQAGLSP